MMEKDTYRNDFVPWEQYINREKLAYRQQAKQYYDRLLHAFQLVVKYFELHRLNEQITNDEDTQTPEDPPPNGDGNATDGEEASDEQIVEAALELMYAYGCELYDEYKYTEAADIFFLITHVSPLCYNAWIMLGMSEQMTDNYELASRCYYQATLLKCDLPHPFLYLAQCFSHFDDQEAMRHYLDLLLENKEWEQQFSEIYQAALELANQ